MMIRKAILIKISLFLVLFFIPGMMVFWGWPVYKQAFDATIESQNRMKEASIWLTLAEKYNAALNMLDKIKTDYPNADPKSIEELSVRFRSDIINRDFHQAIEDYKSLKSKITEIQTQQDDEAKKGDLVGTILSANKPLATASIKLFKDNNEIRSIQSADGVYAFREYSGKYSIKITADGYIDNDQIAEIKAKERVTLDIVMKKVAATVPTPTVSAAVTPASNDTTDGSYSRQTVQTDRGSFTVSLLTIDLSAGVEMIVDTASADDCNDNCPVKSLASYVSGNGGFAGIHGTYFCPTAYSACQGKTNSFYYKLHNTNLDKHINWTNGLGDYLPFLRVDKFGTVHYHNTWYEAKDLEMATGISCRPKLVAGGNVVVTENDLDSDKEKYSKITHGFLGTKGQTLYAGIVSGATVLDSAAVVAALGIENAFNVDGGGTSALYYNGSYKVGPGRDMPNAVIFRQR